jgi:transposase
MTLWHNARKSLTKIRVQLTGELDALIHDLPEDLRSQLPSTTTVRGRINVMRKLNSQNVPDPVLRLGLTTPCQASACWSLIGSPWRPGSWARPAS